LQISFTFLNQTIDSYNINFTSFSDNGLTIDTTTQFDFPSADLPVILAGTYEGYN